eukprot:TRINITY_DN455_c0_g1_i1.p5 TRINITY_DN455_c0_g1~~TRINITY_DN455_c0_g1_i1.p5  ORF type:complete len:167 (-),score=11.20 TRINITY_DN455_c0_g1_i1:884-1315(-)
MITYSDVVEEDLVMGAIAHALPDYESAPIWIGLYREGAECTCGCSCVDNSCGCDDKPGCGCLKRLGDFFWVGGRPLGSYANWLGTPCGAGKLASQCLPPGQCVMTWVQKTPYALQAQWLPYADCGFMAHAMCEFQGMLSQNQI